jgi:hypothetical protein
MERFNSFSSDQIILTKRQASMIMASMLLFCLFVGFFLGKRTMIDDFSSKVTKEALHDQIDFLLTTQSFESSQEGAAIIEAEPIVEKQDAVIIADKPEVIAPAIFAQERVSQTHQVIANDNYFSRPQDFPVLDDRPSISNQVTSDAKNPQYAQLIGFGTKQAAQAFVTRLKKHHVSVILKTMISKTAAGKQRTWYQAITPTYESTEELQAEVTKIKRLEHIRGSDIKIVYVK